MGKAIRARAFSDYTHFKQPIFLFWSKLSLTELMGKEWGNVRSRKGSVAKLVLNHQPTDMFQMLPYEY